LLLLLCVCVITRQNGFCFRTVLVFALLTTYAPHVPHVLCTQCISMSLVTPPGDTQAAAWRGPMVTGALSQLLLQTVWKPLDVLVVDMPPGTGDVALTVAQRCNVDGASEFGFFFFFFFFRLVLFSCLCVCDLMCSVVQSHPFTPALSLSHTHSYVLVCPLVIVTTPQQVAVADARKAADLFERVSVPVLGVVENMSSSDEDACPTCGRSNGVFGSGGGEMLADEYGVPVLERIPLEAGVRVAGDGACEWILPIVACLSCVCVGVCMRSRRVGELVHCICRSLIL
jgi:ATP-binding protein involved in chromosome partitioning